MKRNIKNLLFKISVRFVAALLVGAMVVTGWSGAAGAVTVDYAGMQKKLTTKELRELVNGGLTGKYVDDVNTVVQSMRNAIALTENTPEKSAAQSDALIKMSAFASRYRANKESASLYSYTTLRTALNNLASYYNNPSSRKLPEKVRDRVLLELDRVESALTEGR